MFKKFLTRIGTMLGIILFLTMGLTGLALAHGTVDQSFETSGGSISLYFVGARGQSFVPTVDNLVAVDFPSISPGSVRVSIHEGTPDGVELGAVTGPVVNGWNHFDFGTPIPLTPGNPYSIRVSALSGSNPFWDWRQVNFGGDNYPNGVAWECNPACVQTSGGIWDHLFRTYYQEPNTAPTVDAGGPYNGDEGSAITLSGASASDPDGDPLTYSWSVDSALCSFDDASLLNPDLTCSDSGNFTATLYVNDVNGLTMEMYDTNDPVSAVTNGFAGLTPNTFSVTTANGTVSTDSYIVPVVNFPDTAFDTASFFNVGPNGVINGGSSALAPQGDDISIQPPGGNDTFGASFSGYLYLPTGGDVTFQVGIDDAFDLKVNGGTVVQFLGVTDFNVFTGTAYGLPSGFVPITLNYGEYGGEADVVLLSASGGGLPGGVIPQQYLFPHPPQAQSAGVTVNNIAPTLGAISVDQTLVPVNTTINTSADFTDPGILDTHSATWDWGDGTSTGTVTQGAGSGSVNDSHSYSVPGVYTIKLTVTDNDGDASNEAIYQFVVVYDPSAGFVTGGGWIDSPAGAYTNDPSLTGKASFGFVAKYKKGANVPDGNTQFQFKAGDLNFHSTSYEWLVVAGNKAQFKGEGTINGQGSYRFMIWADDDSPDTFRIQISGDTGIIYDNGSQQSLGGGSIVVHNK